MKHLPSEMVARVMDCFPQKNMFWKYIVTSRLFLDPGIFRPRNLSIANHSSDYSIVELNDSDKDFEWKKTLIAESKIIADTISEIGLCVTSSNYTPAFESDFNDVIRVCKNVKSLSLTGEGISDKNLTTIGRHCSNVKTLNLSSCNMITVDGVEDLTRYVSTCLKSLTLSDCEKIGNKSLNLIGKYCSNLQALNLFGCELITDDGIENLARNLSTCLTSLNLSRCKNIGNDALKSIAKFCSNLQSLDLGGCKLITDDGIEHLTRNLSTCLASLNLGCTNVGNNSVKSIGKYCSNLQSLELDGCKLITGDGIQDLTTNLSTRLTSLNLGCTNIGNNLDLY